MRFNKIRLYFSPQRIDRYLVASGNSKARAISLYKANLRVAQSFHPLLGALEVALRNQINTILTAHFGDADWIINQKKGFMVDPSLTYMDRRRGVRVVNDFLKMSVEKSERRFRRLRIPVSSGKIISDQSLGFWTDLFEVHHYKLLLGRPIQAFNHLPSGHGRKEVSERLNKIRLMRNRINHNEPVCFKGSCIDFSCVEDVYSAAIDILSWIDPDLVNWVKDINGVQSKIAKAKVL